MPRVRYDGPHREVLVIHPTTRRELARVKRGELLPEAVPAEIAAELAARGNWTTVADPPAPAPKRAVKRAAERRGA